MSPSPFRSLSTTPPAPTPLWISSNFTDSGYAVYVTDFMQLWCSTQTRRGISFTCEEENCPIDPDIDESNLKQLLDTLEKSLDTQTQDSPTLLRDPDQPRAIILQTLTPLAKNSPPLRWRFLLKPATPEQHSEVLVKPFVKLSGIYRDRITELSSVVRYKDQLIERLVDMLKESGTNVKDAIPRRRREALKPYEEGDWTEPSVEFGVQAGAEWSNVFPAGIQARYQRNEWWFGLDDSSTSQEFNRSFSAGRSSYQHEKPHHQNTGSNRSSARPEKSEDTSARTKPKRVPSPSPPLAETDTDTDDGEFEVQRTPSPVRAKVKRSPSLEPLPRPTKVESSKAKRVIPAKDEDETASEDDDDLDIPMRQAPTASTTSAKNKAPSPSPSLAPQSPKLPAKKKLGALGKKAAPPAREKIRSVTPPSPPAAPSSNAPPAVAPSPVKRKLGALGGGLAKRKKSEEPETSSSVKEEVVVPPKTEEELMEEEADRKRKELEGKLEKEREKAAKKGKKRRF